jgi:hypothetical protein
MANPSLGALLALPPHHPSFAATLASLRAELRDGQSLYLYCLHDGVLALSNPDLRSLSLSRTCLFACALAAEVRDLPRLPEITYGGLGLLSDLIAGTDRFVAHTPTSPSPARPAVRPRTNLTSQSWPILVSLAQSPLVSPLAAEGLRVAAGLASCARYDVVLALCGLEGGTWAELADHLEAQAELADHLSTLQANGGTLRDFQLHAQPASALPAPDTLTLPF